MHRSGLLEIIVSVAFVGLLMLFLFDPYMLMPVYMMMLLGLIVLFALFTGFIWKETARDEREHLHRMLAGRYAFLAGCAVLVSGIVVQGLSHDVDPWLVFALGGMIVVKLVSRLYGEYRS